MRAAFLFVVPLGAAIGFALPHSAPSAPAPVVGSAIADAPRETVLDRDANGHFYAFAEVNGETTRFVVDTGASTIALTQDDARRAHVAFDPSAFQVVGRGASGDVRGQEVMIDTVVLDGKHAAAVHGLVLESSGVSLLGQSYLATINTVEIKGDQMRLKP